MSRVRWGAVAAVVLGLGWYLRPRPEPVLAHAASHPTQPVRHPATQPRQPPPPLQQIEYSGGGLLGPSDLDPSTMVSCTVEPGALTESVELIDDAMPEIPEVARITESILYIPAPRASGTGVLKVPGFLPVRIGWKEGRCDAEPIMLHRGGAAIVGKVHNAAGEPEDAVEVEGCGGLATTDVDGSFYLEAVPGARCTVRASRRDGLFAVFSDPVEVEPQPNEDQVIELSLPEFIQGGLGLVVARVDGVLRVAQRIQGGAAEELLADGDQIIAIEGESVESWSVEDFERRALGREGSEIELRVLGEDGEQTVLLERRSLQD